MDFLTAVLQPPSDIGQSVSELPPLLVRVTLFWVSFLAVFLVGRFVFVPAILRVVRERNRNNPTLAEAISRYLRLFVLLGALFTGLAVAGFTEIVGGSALVVAAGTLALGVAGQRVIGSLLSGAVLVADPQFNIGNYIEWQGGDGGAGEVTSITLRVTRVRTLDGELVTIPNTTLTDEAIVRPFDQQRTRETEYIDIAYEADIDATSQLLLGVTDGIDAIADEPAPSVDVDDLGPDAVTLRVHYWVTDPRQNLASVRSAFARTVKDRLEREGIEINPVTKRDLKGRIQIDGAAG